MLPRLTESGDLPAGVHQATRSEIEERFARGSEARTRAFAKPRHLCELAQRTGALKRFMVFGSFVSAGPDPRDVDIALVMSADFRIEDAPRESRTLFSQPDAEARFGASVFWLREGMLNDDQMRYFLETWQLKRDGARRGIVEVTA